MLIIDYPSPIHQIHLKNLKKMLYEKKKKSQHKTRKPEHAQKIAVMLLVQMSQKIKECV